MFRRMKTTQELRHVQSAEEQDVPVRPKRRKKRLPNAWDDIRPGRRGRDDKAGRATRPRRQGR